MYGVIDIGSNTIRLVIYKVEDGEIKPMLNKKEAAGLVGYVGSDKCLSREGINKAASVLLQFKAIIEAIGIEEVFPFATASLRNISNTEEVLKELKAISGFDIRVFTGEEEAIFDYYGAVYSTELDNGLLVDIGGGSTELVSYRNKKICYAVSLPFGSLTLFNNMVDKILPTRGEWAKITKEVSSQLKLMELPKCGMENYPICGVGGTARALLALLKSLESIPEKAETYNAGNLSDLAQLLEKNPKQFVRYLLKSSPDRIHTFAPGLGIMKAIVEYYNVDNIITSNYGVREGYLYHTLMGSELKK